MESGAKGHEYRLRSRRNWFEESSRLIYCKRRKGVGAKAEDGHFRKVCLCSQSMAMALQKQILELPLSG